MMWPCGLLKRNVSLHLRRSIRRFINTSEHDNICVIGAGPSGMLFSSLLSQFKIPHTLIDRRTSPTSHPQAHFINARSMEILRDWTPEVFNRIIRESPPSSSWSDFSFCYSLLGHEFSRIDNFSASSTSPEFWSLSPTSVLHLAQNRFEAALRDELERLRPRGYCRTLFGYSVSNVSHNNTTGWNLSLNSLEMNKFSTSSGPSSLSLYPKYLVAADGANSLVRRQLGIELVGREDMQTLVNVHFICRGLRDKLKRPAMLYFVFNEVSVCVVVAHDPALDEWVCQIPVFSVSDARTAASGNWQDYISEKQVIEILSYVVGEQFNPTVLSIRLWTMHAQVAERFHLSFPYTPTSSHTIHPEPFKSSIDRGNYHTFLIGDAAHRFPPAGGFGMNTGLQDAHNLACKLAHTLAVTTTNSSSSDIKDSESQLAIYDSERRGVAVANTCLSLHNFDKTTAVAATMGVDPALAQVAVKSVKSTPFLSVTAKTTLLNSILQVGLQPLRALSSPSNPYSALRVALLQQMVRRGDILPLIYPKYDLDYVYFPNSDAKLPPTCPSLISSSIEREPAPSSYMAQGLQIGGRIPHFWLQLSCPTMVGSNNEKKSHFVSSTSLPTLGHRLIEHSVSLDSCSVLPPPYILLLFEQGDISAETSSIKLLEKVKKQLSGVSYLVALVRQSSAELSNLSHILLQKQLQRPAHVQITSQPSLNSHDPDSATMDISSCEDISYTSASLSTVLGVHGFEVVDVSGKFMKFCADKKVDAVLLRPDGHIADTYTYNL